MRNTHADDAAVLGQIELNLSPAKRIRRERVQQTVNYPGRTDRVDINAARELLDSAKQERFWSRVTIGEPNECWPWTRSCNANGYGFTSIGKAVTLAHRLAYVLQVGPITPGLLIRHKCDNPPCCNPSHLIMGTFAENAADRKRPPSTAGTALPPLIEAPPEGGHLAWCHCGRAFLTLFNRLCPLHRQNRVRLPA